MTNFQLYPWQEECLGNWAANGGRGIANVITGAGKTVLALAAIDRLSGCQPLPLKVKIVVPTASLLAQWRDALLGGYGSRRLSRTEIGCYSGTIKDPPGRPVMIYVINSARYCLARHILADLEGGGSVLLIADECHHYTSAENQRIFEFLPYLGKVPGRYYSLGLSATPQTTGYDEILIPALGREIYRYSFSDALRMKTITPYALLQIALPLDPDEREGYEELSDYITMVLTKLRKRFPHLRTLGRFQFFSALQAMAVSRDIEAAALARTLLNLSFKRKNLMCNAQSRLSCTCRLIGSLDPGSKIMIFGERVDQADRLYHLLNSHYPGQVGRCHSRMGKQTRKNALERYQNGETRILVSCRSLDEGYDVPAASVGIVFSSAKALRQRIQRLGRILRHHEGKDVARLYYLYLDRTVETPAFFETLPEQICACHLSYCHGENAFIFPEYEAAAKRILADLEAGFASQAALTEARKCLLLGMARGDWLLGRLLGNEIWERNIKAAKTTGERNYWVCMRKMGENL